MVITRLSPALALTLCLMAPIIAPSQTTPAFNVASIRLGDGDHIEARPELTPGRLIWTADFSYLIAYAYNSDIQWVRGTWPSHNTYRIEATFDPSATNAQVRAMLQSLLATRFGMKAHRGTAEAPGFALLVAKGGPKLHESKPDASGAPSENAGRIWATLPEKNVVEVTGNQVSTSQLATEIARDVKAQVWDKTGLSGTYDFHFRATLDDPSLADASLTYQRVADALRQQYGLQLEKQTGPVETIVVDYIEPLPTEN
jgi:uncharacterized protein (TIGR03435 family)